MYDFAIAPGRGCGQRGWEVLHLQSGDDGREIAAPVASFGERCHAEAFLRDLVAMVDGRHDRAAVPMSA